MDAINEEVNIPLCDLVIGRKIGGGAFSEVFKCKYFGETYAVKKIEKNEAIAKYLESEVEILEHIKHENLNQLIGTAFDEKYVYIVLEYVKGGDLGEFLGKYDNVSWKLRVQLAEEVARGIAYLHENHILHRDIKTGNVLLEYESDMWIAKLCDFGFARRSNTNSTRSQRMTFCGTDAYMAPELLFEEEYGLPVDVFSFGVILAALITHINPEDLPQPGQFMHRVPNDFFKVNESDILQKIQDGCPTELTELTLKCLAYEFASRPTIFEALYILEDLSQTVTDSAGQTLPRLISSINADNSQTNDSNSNDISNKTNSNIQNSSFSKGKERLIVEEEVELEVELEDENNTINTNTITITDTNTITTINDTDTNSSVIIAEPTSIEPLIEADKLTSATSPSSTGGVTSNTESKSKPQSESKPNLNETITDFANMDEYVDFNVATSPRYQPKKQGFLHIKQVQGFRNWKKRYFLLDNNILRWAKDELDIKSIDKVTVVDLTGCSCILTPGYAVECRFQIILPYGDIINISAPNYTEMLDWTQKINIGCRCEISRGFSSTKHRTDTKSVQYIALECAGDITHLLTESNVNVNDNIITTKVTTDATNVTGTETSKLFTPPVVAALAMADRNEYRSNASSITSKCSRYDLERYTESPRTRASSISSKKRFSRILKSAPIEFTEACSISNMEKQISQNIIRDDKNCFNNNDDATNQQLFTSLKKTVSRSPMIDRPGAVNSTGEIYNSDKSKTSEVEETLKRIQSHRGVEGVLIINSDGMTLKSTLDPEKTNEYAALLAELARKARSVVRTLDPSNDLTFLRVRSKKHEIMVAPDKDYVLIVIQNPNLEGLK